MKYAGSLRYEFDPCGQAQTRLADWERTVAELTLQQAAEEVAGQKKVRKPGSMRLSLWAWKTAPVLSLRRQLLG